MPLEDENNIYGGFTIYAKWGEIQGQLNQQRDLQNVLDSKVDKVSGKGLSTNDYTDEEKSKVGSAIQGVKGNGTLINPDSQQVVNVTPLNIGAVPITRTINGKPLSGSVTLSASDVGAVPTNRTINGKSLSGDITLYTYGTSDPSGGANGDLYFKYN